MRSLPPITQLLDAAATGDRDAAGDLLPVVYAELRRLAAARMAEEKPGQTLEPTALVHEAFLRLVGSERTDGWNGREHFFAAAAEAMRHILVDIARRKKAVKHGGDRCRVDLDVQVGRSPAPAEEILAVDEALTRLAQEDPIAAQIVQFHFYAGMSMEEIAVALQISRATAYREWSYARAWLRCALGDDAPGE